MKKVIWFYNDTDLEELSLELKNQFLLKYLDNQEYTQNLKNRQSEIDTFAKKRYFIRYSIFSIFFQKILSTTLYKILRLSLYFVIVL